MNDESVDFNKSLAEGGMSGNTDIGPVNLAGSAEVAVGTVQIHGDLDFSHLIAQGDAKATTVEVTADGAVDTPIGDGTGHVHAAGPSAEVQGEVSPNEVKGKIGASAGSADASLHTDFLGQEEGGSVEVGLKAEVGFEVGSTTGVDLPLFSVSVPTPSPVDVANDALDIAETVGLAIGDLFSSDDGQAHDSQSSDDHKPYADGQSQHID